MDLHLLPGTPIQVAEFQRGEVGNLVKRTIILNVLLRYVLVTINVKRVHCKL